MVILRLAHTCRGVCPQLVSLPGLGPAYPPPLALAAEIATAIARHLVSYDWRPPGALPQPTTMLSTYRAYGQ